MNSNTLVPFGNSDLITYFSYQRGKANITSDNLFSFSILEDGTIHSLSGTLNPYIRNVYQLLDLANKREELYLTAVDNMIKKNEFLQLTIQLDQGLISEDEFEKELTNNEEKYLIKVRDNVGEDYLEIICEILPKLKRSFNSNDVTELFSIPSGSFNKFIDCTSTD